MHCLAALIALLGIAAPASAWTHVHNGGLSSDRLVGGGRADHLSGREGPDTLLGRGGSDLLSGDNGPDVLYGGNGHDTLLGGAGRDRFYGAAGNDIVSGGFGSDYESGGSGDDALDGGQDDDTIVGGSGDDSISGGSGIDVLDGGPGNDRIFADSGADVIDAGAGDDAIVVDGTAPTRVICGPGHDTVYITVPPNQEGDYGSATSKASQGKRASDCERLFATDAVIDPNVGIRYLAPDGGGTRAGTTRDDVLLGGLGPDELRGGRGNDVLWGLRQAGQTSSEPDVLDAGPGDDTIYGASSFQRISGGSGDDRIQAGIGSGTISGGSGADTIRMRGDGRGTYKINGGSGNDTVYARGGKSRARITCGSGRDVVHVDVNDRVSRDCERVIGTAARPRAATWAVPPRTLAAAVVGLDGDPLGVMTFGSDTATHFECVKHDEPGLYYPYDPRFVFKPCTSPLLVKRGSTVDVRAVDDDGNVDPTPAVVPIPAIWHIITKVQSGFFYNGVLPTFAGTRTLVVIKGEPLIVAKYAFQCRTEIHDWAPCTDAFYLPITRVGQHAIQVRQQPSGDAARTINTPPLGWTVTDPGGAASIVGLQFPVVLERGARLARRVPRVRLALNTSSRIVAEVFRGRTRLARAAVAGVTGPNTVKVPASVLGRLRPGRYSLVVTATSPIGPPAVQRLSFAVVPHSH